jgi:exodeoxyribonuclease V alpha subunit
LATSFSLGDKVMQIENNYDREVFNGDIGFVTGIDQVEDELAVTFDGRVVSYPFGELDELVLCYATTIHKSQGSEYPVVVIPISTQHFMMLKRNLIYTGITRGKRHWSCLSVRKERWRWR